MEPFSPRYTLTPKILRQLKAIERTTGFLEAVRLRPQWIDEVRARTNEQEALASLQIEGNSLTMKRAFELADQAPEDDELDDPEREFLNYLRSFEAIGSLRGERGAVLARGDLLNLHRILVQDVRGLPARL